MPAAAAGGSCAAGVSAASLNELFAGEVDGIAGLDSVTATPLPDGRVLWLAQDVYVNDGPPVSDLRQSHFAHNGGFVQTGSCFQALHGVLTDHDTCGAQGDSSFLAATMITNCFRWFWPMGAALDADGNVDVFLVEMRSDHGGGAGDGAYPARTWRSVLDGRTLAPLGIAPAADDGGDVLYGWAVQTQGDWTYLFGWSYDQFDLPDPSSPPPDRTYLARVPAGRLDQHPTYWNGTTWTTDRAAAAPINLGADAGAGSEAYAMAPVLVEGTWVSVTKRGDWSGSVLDLQTAPAAQGPWTTYRSIVVPTRTVDGTTNTYAPRVLPFRDAAGHLIVTISNNAWAGTAVAYPHPEIYRQTFFEADPPPGMVSPAVAGTGGLLGFAAQVPQRALDTRGVSRLAAGEVRRVALGSVVDPSARAVAVNLTAVAPARSGFLTAWSCDGDRPWVSNLNVVAGTTQGAASIVATSADGSGAICVYASTATDLVVDVFGRYVDRSAGGASFHAVGPERRYDSRTTQRLQPGVPVRVPIEAGASAAAVNVAMIQPVKEGWVAAYPCDRPLPGTATVNSRAKAIVSNFAQVALAATGELCLVANVATDVTLDLVGTFHDDGHDAAGSGWWYQAVAPTRVVDSRGGVGVPLGMPGRSAAGRWTTAAEARPSLVGVPANVQALVVTVVAVAPLGDGWMTVAPCAGVGGYRTVALNTTAGRDVANLTIVPTRAASGTDVCSYSMMLAHLVIDLTGWYVSGS